MSRESWDRPAGSFGPGADGGMRIEPFRALRYRDELLSMGAESLTAPPYDVISPEEHRRLLDASPYNLTRLTLGSIPGGTSSYDGRRELLGTWIREGILTLEESPAFYAYSIEYPAPGSGERKGFLGLFALGKLQPFEAGVVLPHERTFGKVVEDRYCLLEATRANLEPILLLYSDPASEIDALLEAHCAGAPLAKVEAKPGEIHAVYPIHDRESWVRLRRLFSLQRPIIADGHHRYTTSLNYALASRVSIPYVPGADWQLMTFANLYSPGVTILGTHRLVTLKRNPPGHGSSRETPVRSAIAVLLDRLELSDAQRAQFRVETRDGAFDVRFPSELLSSRKGVARTAYALLHDVVFGEWLAEHLDPERGVRYFKEGTGERESLERGEGDILFRMKPVDRREFQSVVEGGEVFPHKTTYFYPKLWSGLLLWRLEEPETSVGS